MVTPPNGLLMPSPNAANSGDQASVGGGLIGNSATIAGARLLGATVSLAAVPVMIAKLGVEGFGTWEALYAMATLGSILQSAVAGTLLWRFSDLFGRSDRDEVARWVRLGLSAVLALLLVLVPLSWAVRGPVLHLIHVPATYERAAGGLFPLIVLLLVVGGFADTLEAVIGGAQRTGIVSLNLAVAVAVNYAVAIAGLIAGWGLFALAAGVAAGVLMRIGVAYVLARRIVGAVSVRPAIPRRRDAAALRYGSLLMVGYVSAALRGQTDKLVLAALASPVLTGYYGIAARLANLVLEFSRFFYNPLLSAVAALKAQDRWADVRRLYNAVMTVVPTVSGAVAVIVAGLSDRLMVLWVGHSYGQVALILLILLTGNTFAVILTGAGSALTRGAGVVWVETAYVSVGLLLNLILTVVLVITIGPLGTVVASGASWAISSLVFVFVLHRVLDLPVSATVRGVTVLGCTATAAAVMRVVSNLIPASTTRGNALLAVTILSGVALSVYAGLLAVTGVVSPTRIQQAVATFRGRRDAPAGEVG